MTTKEQSSFIEMLDETATGAAVRTAYNRVNARLQVSEREQLLEALRPPLGAIHNLKDGKARLAAAERRLDLIDSVDAIVSTAAGEDADILHGRLKVLRERQKAQIEEQGNYLFVENLDPYLLVSPDVAKQLGWRRMQADSERAARRRRRADGVYTGEVYRSRELGALAGSAGSSLLLNSAALGRNGSLAPGIIADLVSWSDSHPVLWPLVVMSAAVVLRLLWRAALQRSSGVSGSGAPAPRARATETSSHTESREKEKVG